MLKNPKKLLFIILVAIITVPLLSIVYLENSYKVCHEKISENYMKNMRSFSCYDLEYSDLSKVTKPLSGYTNVFEISRDKIGNNNGVTCSGIAFVAIDLPKFAKSYVAYHEYLHIQSNDSETQVNIKAGLSKPFGMLQTVTYSVQRTLFSKGFNQCSLAGLWKTFKVYFLGDSFTDLINFEISKTN